MGMAWEYRCADCGRQFSATEDFSFGFSGDVVTPIVCMVHGLTAGDTGINLAAGGDLGPEVIAKQSFPCSACGSESPRWDRKSCPSCGCERLDFVGQIMWD